MHRLYLKVNKGFTLFELLVVVTIIGLLLMIAMPNYIEARENAMTTTCITNQRIICSGATIYMMEESQSLVGMGHKARLDALVNNGYIKGSSWAECPSSGDNDYDDYTILFEGDIVVDVDCDANPSEHIWP